MKERPSRANTCSSCRDSYLARAIRDWQKASLCCGNPRSREYTREVRDTGTCDKYAPEEVV